MLVKKLYLKDFRNAEEDDISFGDGINVIYGKNAAGKTNILESIFYFAAGKSFRNCKDREMIAFGKEKALAEMVFSGNYGEKKMKAELSRSEKRKIFLGANGPLKLSEYLGNFRAVVFTPDHLSLIKGSPENRRRFLDLAICQSFPRYASSISEYNRVTVQKNALLKSERISDDLLAVYNDRLAILSAVVTVNRRKYVSKLCEEASAFLGDMSGGKETLALHYQSGCGDALTQEEIREAYKKLFAEKLEAEKEKKISLYGAHKDDFLVCVNKKSARLYGSQGQQRSTVLALKLAEGELSYKLTGEYPVFLLDDILSELDEERQKYILSRIGERQVIITGCESDAFYGEARKIFVNEGKICISD
ncbi:MAG: DNA replication/repair protein RecF [Clostridiales bacterium]|nr:DNA replication/repair protein RecF [Candidatus Coliplasma equi]